MLTLLDYSVEFPTTGRSFQNRIEFAPGVTAIVGRNETGKTVVFEMIRYALFGKAALRGLSSDYRNLNVHLEFTLPNKAVVIKRAPRSEQLFVNDELQAVGAEALNKAIPTLLGYGLDVFDVTQAALQGDLGRLTEMRPTARRQMVDRLVGLDALEAIEVDCKKEARAQDTLGTALMTSMAAPIEPVKPDDYAFTGDLEANLNQIMQQDMERRRLLGVLPPVAPKEPEGGDYRPIEELEQLQAQRQTVMNQRSRIEGALNSIPVSQVSLEQLEKAIAWQSYMEELRRRGPQPSYSAEYLEEQAALHAKIDANALLIQKYKSSDTLHCPKCAHEFVDGLTEEQLELVTSLMAPQLDQRTIAREQNYLEAWATPLDEPEKVEVPQLQRELAAHARQEERADLQLQLDQLDIPADVTTELRAAREFKEAMVVYDERLASYERAAQQYDEAQVALENLPDRAEEVKDLQRRLGEARSYENNQQRFIEANAVYTGVIEKATEARELADGYSKGSTALANTRAKVKQELAPSLAAAASSLISAMTNGERRFVDVDHDFNIMVDGQPLQTLSGSGKSVVNLALRLGLGQVLTSKVLPIFLGDEIDKDMDAVRASATHETLQSLKQFLAQIIIITHKETEVDSVVRL